VVEKKEGGGDAGIIMTRRRFLKTAAGAAGAIALLKGFYNTTGDAVRLKRQKITIAGVSGEGLPRGFSGLKIAFLSDFHSSSLVPIGTIRRAAELVMRESPDLPDVILLGGDFVTGTNEVGAQKTSASPEVQRRIKECVEALSPLKAPMGIYGVLGNHDFWSGREAVQMICQEFSERLGVVWLRNSSVKLKRGIDAVDLMGIDDYWEPGPGFEGAYKGLDPGGVKILLSHNPDVNYDIDAFKKRVDLVLSGHTHGGQIVMPFIGAPFMPSLFGQKYRVGLVADGARQTFITTGVGVNFLPIRYNCPAEVVLIELV
jgi:hypothetical protein